MQTAHRYFSGMSGIQLPVPRYQYPQEFQSKSRLTYYAHQFNSIEINSCFYKLPRAATVTRWSAEVPERFVFTFKLSKDITHIPELAFDHQRVADFFDVMESVGDKKGCVLIQFPPKLTTNFIFKLETLLTEIDQHPSRHTWKIAVEFRNSSWYNEDVYAILDAHNVALVIHDIPKSKTPPREITTDFVYVRFHGPKGDYDGSYEDEFLAEYASNIREWITEGKSVFVYFNNTKGNAFGNLTTLNRYV